MIENAGQFISNITGFTAVAVGLLIGLAALGAAIGLGVLGGKFLEAKAMTTALSPERIIFVRMIEPSANQKAAD